jgi:hypothetical protein
VLAYVATAVTQAVQEYRTQARGSMAAGVECDLCEEVVTEWEWVDKGWSLACRPCLDKIRAQAMERCAEIAEGFESPFSQEFPTEAWRGKLQTVILQALLGAPRDGDDTQPERAVAEPCLVSCRPDATEWTNCSRPAMPRPQSALRPCAASPFHEGPVGRRDRILVGPRAVASRRAASRRAAGIPGLGADPGRR